MIALDAATTNAGATNVSSQTVSHTTSGTNRYLFVGVVGSVTSGASNITGVTYANVSMTQVDSSSFSGDRWNYLFRLINPASGANNVVISGSAGGDIISIGIVSYTGVAQVAPEATITNTRTGTSPFNSSITTVANNAWIIGGIHGNATPTAGTGTTERQSNSLYDSNGPLAVGSNTLQVTYAGSISFDGIMASIAPAAVAGGTAGFFEV